MSQLNTRSVILIRILGNDLPPRHKKGQTFENVAFTLKYESKLENCKKLWILNRIVDLNQETKIINLLRLHEQPYIRLAFQKHTYASVKNADRDTKLNFIIDLNHARNVALSVGRRCAFWVLPFDGNCFFTEEGWRLFRNETEDRSDKPYIIVPMARVTDNKLILERDYMPDIYEVWDYKHEKIEKFPTEPQIGFRFNTKDLYDDNCRYGKLSKVDMLWRLGVPGIWDQWYTDLREKALQNRSEEFGEYLVAGYVMRLSSRNRRAERSHQKRKRTREAGLDILICRIEKNLFYRVIYTLFRRSVVYHFYMWFLSRTKAAIRNICGV